MGNIRLSYSDLNGNGLVNASEIIEENNYYPFGMKQRGYNGVVNGTPNTYKTFQGQEFTDAFGLNVHEWKYRMSDPSIGRFWQIDPLAEKYPWMTTYQFSANQPIHAPELEGMESFNDLNIRNELTQYGRVDIPAEEVEAAQDAFDDAFLATTLVGASLFTPGPDEVLFAGLAATLGKTLTKAVTQIFSKGDEVKDVVKTVDKISDTKKGVTKAEGVIYKRVDKTGKQKDYIGQAKSEKRYEARQKEHRRANKDAEYEFTEIDRGKPCKDLNQKEQKHLDAHGGPTNKSNPNGGTSNKKNVIKKDKEQ